MNPTDTTNSKPVNTTDIGLEKFTIYYLFRYHNLKTELANTCAFAGLGNVQMLIDFFNDGREHELLELPFCTQKTIPELKKLCKEFSDPETVWIWNQKFYQRIIDYGTARHKTKTKPNNEKMTFKKWHQLKDAWEKADKESFIKINIDTFINDEKLSIRTIKYLTRISKHENLKELIDDYILHPGGFEYFAGAGKTVSNELHNIFECYILKLRTRPVQNSNKSAPTNMTTV